MSTVTTQPVQKSLVTEENDVSEIADDVQRVALEAKSEDTQAKSTPPASSNRPWHVYTRREIVNLSASPLVKCPEGMPAFKDWFGSVLFRNCF